MLCCNTEILIPKLSEADSVFMIKTNNELSLLPKFCWMPLTNDHILQAVIKWWEYFVHKYEYHLKYIASNLTHLDSACNLCMYIYIGIWIIFMVYNSNMIAVIYRNRHVSGEPNHPDTQYLTAPRDYLVLPSVQFLGMPRFMLYGIAA